VVFGLILPQMRFKSCLLMLMLLFSGRLLYAQENALYQSIEYKASGLTFEAALKGFETRIGLPIQYDAALAPKNAEKSRGKPAPRPLGRENLGTSPFPAEFIPVTFRS
jgi:hypothetical protein